MASLSDEEELETFEKSEITWSLPNFKKKGEYDKNLFSSIFPEDDKRYKWKLGLLTNRYEDKVLIYLTSAEVRNIDSSVFIKFKVRFLNSYDELISSYQKMLSFPGLIQSSVITESIEKLKTLIREDGILKIKAVVFAEVLTLKAHHTMTKNFQEGSSIIKLSRDLGNMFKSGAGSDFVFICGGAKIPVHTAILAARSPVFAAMFRQDMSEKHLGHTDVKDISEEIMRVLLHFIYTGTVENLLEDKAKDLLYAADKYQQGELKKKCGEMLTDCINVSNALNILELADKYKVLELENKATDYILKNHEQFANPTMFEKIEKTCPYLLSKLFMKLSKHIQEASKKNIETK